MTGRVKQEALGTSPSATAPSSRTGAFALPTVAANGRPAPRGRSFRSGAPSAETRSVHNGIHDGSETGNGDTNDVLMLEFRHRVPSPAANNASFMSHGFSRIGDKIKSLNDTLGELQALGIQHVTSLPELVLVGDQSAGKSSLMSSFAGIDLPRSEGACTRCPVHIRLSRAHSGSWSCRISLQQDYEYRPPAKVTRANPFGPWFEQRREIKEFAALTEPSDIEETLIWAQRATLNPNRDHGLYKPGIGEIWRRSTGSDAEDFANEAAFSPNTVALDILAPGLADLSFYDLPGVFTNAKQDEDQYLVKVVENLTAKYISHQQAIILWAVPMNADPETSSTFSIIRNERAQARTIGIMTKADLLPPGPNAAAQWMSMLRGEQHRIGLGYFMTARFVSQIADEPSPSADGLERQNAHEEAFFNKQLAGYEWQACFREFDERCGVTRLVEFMSQQLGTEFAKCLPQIKEKVASKLMDVDRELSQLPDMPENPELEVRRSLADFASRIHGSLEGAALSPRWGDVVHSFRLEILNLKPRFVVKVDVSQSERVDANGRIDLTHDESINSPQFVSHIAPDPVRRLQLDNYLDNDTRTSGPPSKRQRMDTGDGPGGPVKAELPPELSLSLSSTPRMRPKTKSLREVRAIIVAKSKPGMPGIVTEDVYNSLCMEAVQPWDVPLQKLLESTYRLLDETQHQLLCEAFTTMRSRLIFKKASAVLKQFISDRFLAVRDVLLQNYKLETRKFYTLDKDSLARHEQNEARILARHRHHYRMMAYLGDRGADRSPPRPWELMAEEERGREEHRMSQEATKLGPDPYRAELSVCAYVRGYYLTASTRFIDICTLNIISGLIPDVTETLSKWYIDTQLGLFNGMTTEAFRALMEEDPETSHKRDRLKMDHDRFQRTMESIERLENVVQ